MILLQSVVSGILSGGAYTLLGLGFALTLGSLGFVNFAHGMFIAIGMYLAFSGSEWTGLSPLVLAPIVTVALVAIGAALYPLVVAPTLRKSHEVQIVVTLLLMNALTALLQLIYLTDLHALSGLQKTWLIPIGDDELGIESAKLTSFLVAVAVVIALSTFLRRTRFGKCIRACTNNPLGARVVGLNVERISWAVFLIGTGCAGLAGALMMSYSVVDPYVGLDLTIAAFMVSVMAGQAISRILYSGIAFGVIESVAGSLVSQSFGRVAVFLGFLLVLGSRPRAAGMRRLFRRSIPSGGGASRTAGPAGTGAGLEE